jgi:hypothetical protein
LLRFRWLRGLGLGQYETTFRENEINQKVLPHLTAEDLKNLGVKGGLTRDPNIFARCNVTKKYNPGAK